MCDVVPAYEKGGSFELSDQALFLRSSEEAVKGYVTATYGMPHETDEGNINLAVTFCNSAGFKNIERDVPLAGVLSVPF